MKSYTIEEFIKRRKSENFTVERYFRLEDKKWCFCGCFARYYYPIRQEKIENLDCIIFISNLGYEYAVEISELQKLGILKKEEEFVVPDIFWVRVTEENVEILKKWSNITCLDKNYIVGKYKHKAGITVGCDRDGITKGDTFDFGNELSFKDFKKYILKEEPMKITSLKEAYIVKCDTKEQTREVMQHIKLEFYNWVHWKYVINHLENGISCIYDTILEKYSHLPILTFLEWKQLKDKEMNKDNKKIIGYKVPCDMFGGNIKKGWILYKDSDGNSYRPKGHGPLNALPKEIVETWEAHYESEEIKIPMANGAFELVIKDGKVWHKNEDITRFVEEMIEWWQRLYGDTHFVSFGSYSASVNEITFSKTGCQNHKTSIKEWINIHNKLHGK